MDRARGAASRDGCRPGSRADRWVAEIDGKLYPTQDGPGCGVPIESAINPACAAGAADLDQRLADMDAEGIDVQVLFGGLIIGLTSYDDAGFALDVARAYNDWLLGKVCGHNPERLKGVATVPLQDVSAAIAEAERVRAAGRRRRHDPAGGRRRATSTTTTLQPFFEACAVADLAVAVHSAPGMNLPLPAPERFANYAQVHCLSFPVDQMVAFTALAMGGVLDRFPTLRVAFLESGTGWVPYFVHRMHEHLEKRAELVPAMRTDPRELLARGQCYFSFEAEEPLLVRASSSSATTGSCTPRTTRTGTATSPAPSRRSAASPRPSATTAPPSSSATTPATALRASSVKPRHCGPSKRRGGARPRG